MIVEIEGLWLLNWQDKAVLRLETVVVEMGD